MNVFTKLPAFSLGLLILAGTAAAQEAPAEPEPAGEAVPAEEGTGPKITFHGFLTQAYAQSDGHQIFGIDEEGTADYRSAALQIRADLSERNVFVAQFSHERFGASRIQEAKEDLELDWLFYERRFGDASVKVGRVQIPFGIYNEVRDVGTLLPFYRPSHNFYGEVAYSSETVDGIVLSHDLALGDWGLETDFHYGDWEFLERDFLTGAYVNRAVDDSFGVELWLQTPLPGLRVGAGGMRFDIETPFPDKTWDVYHFSLAGDFERFSFHGEVKDVLIGESDLYLGYAHLGVHLTEKWTVNLQKELFELRTEGFPSFEVDDERILGISYAFDPSLVLKVEHHWSEGGFWLESYVPAPGDFSIPETRYWLASLSTSF